MFTAIAYTSALALLLVVTKRWGDRMQRFDMYDKSLSKQLG